MPVLRRLRRRGAWVLALGFVSVGMLGGPFQVYSNANDERFLFYGAANAQGLRRVDSTVRDASAIEVAKGSVWAMAVLDDAIIYGEHGASPADTTADIGSIFSIAK